MVLKIAFWIAAILISFSIPISAEVLPNSPFRTGILLLKEGPGIQGDVSDLSDSYFIRNARIGKKISKNQVLDFVSEEYARKIQNSSSMGSAWESILYFHASSETQWKGFPQDPNSTNGQWEDSYTRWIKVALLLLTTAAYADAVQQNNALKNSYSGFNGHEKAAFQNANTRYQTLAGITLGFFTFTTIKAYVRFGRNDHYQDLRIPGREIKSVSDWIDPKASLSGISSFQFGITQNF
ncbi:hypothetical protein [Leptospira stimsonii]|uniref:Uncharacterized protein n=1 Tax=Leptospira stimsonii TaxID=2202203 RepID=A0A396Z615_9LEPT|nr:hypothetical protein [Leptospira stimsonii]RHX89134.1 hypothetical protein DLM75_14850 [Leptospira stimsonii]